MVKKISKTTPKIRDKTKGKTTGGKLVAGIRKVGKVLNRVNPIYSAPIKK